MGLLDQILGTNSSSPTDALIQHILGMNNEPDPGMSGEMQPDAPPMTMGDSGGGGPTPTPQAGSSGSMNEIFGMPPDVAAKVTGNPTLYPNLAAVLGQKQTKVTPRKPLDYLIAAASPLISGLAQMAMSHRRSDRKMNFFSGLAGGGLNSLVSEAGRTDRMKAADRQRQIEDILLQKTVRGTPVSGVNTDTGKPEYRFATGETMGNFGPVPRAVPHAQTTKVQMPDGSEQVMERNANTGVWEPAQQAQTTTDQTGKVTKKIFPLTSAKTPEKPMRELRVGSDIAGAKKGSADDQYYWVEQGKKPVASGLYRSLSDRPTREGDLNRADKQQVNQWAVKALAASHSPERLGPGAKPEEYANDATELFRKLAGKDKALAGKASEVETAIRNVARSVKGGNELAAILAQALKDAGLGGKQPEAGTATNNQQ